MDNIKKQQDDLDNKNIISLNEFDELLIFTDKFDKINILSNKIDEIFISNKSLVKYTSIDNINSFDVESQVIFNHIYEREFERGNIEYKRSLESYYENEKTNKLIRQIYWRIYEGIVTIDKEYCYYIIGIEDSGTPSFLSKIELSNSLNFISNCIEETELNYSYLFVKNIYLNYDYIIVKFWTNEYSLIDFF
jgi:hypothetical protein